MTNDQLKAIQTLWDELDFMDNIVELLRQQVHPSRRPKLEYLFQLLDPPGEGDSCI